MEYIDSIWQVGVIALIAGAMIGALAYRFFSPSVQQSDELKSELDETKQELSNYKASVNSHFDKTSELVNDLTQNYVKVYQHLAEGAQTLGDSRQLNNLLEQQQGKVLLTVDDESGSREEITSAAPADSPPIPDIAPQSAPERPQPGVETAADRDASGVDSGAEETTSSAAAEPEERGDGTETESKPKMAAGDGIDEGIQASDDDAAEDAEPAKPVIDMDKIDRAGDDESPTRAEARSVVAEPTEGIEVPTTRH